MRPEQRFFVKRLVVSFIGLIVVMAGTSLLALSLLGVSAATAPMFTMSLVSGWSFGTWVGIINTIYFVVQLLVLRRDFPVTGWFQLAAVFIAAVAIDMWTAIFSWVEPRNYFEQVAVMLISIVLVGVGTSLMVPARTFFMPFEGMIQMFADIFHIPFPRLKIAADIVAVAFAAVVTLLFLDTFNTVREATVASALLVGPIIGWTLPFSRRVLGAPPA